MPFMEMLWFLEQRCIPSPISLASTWSDAFLYAVGKQSAKEMRATGSHWAFTPNIDVLRDPRWGRVGETFGEDPLYGRKYGGCDD